MLVKHITNAAEYNEFTKPLDTGYSELSDNRFAVACMRHFNILSYSMPDAAFYAIVSVFDDVEMNTLTDSSNYAFSKFLEAYVFTTEKEAREKFLQLLGERISNSYGDE